MESDRSVAAAGASGTRGGSREWGELESRIAHIAEPIAVHLGVSLVGIRYAGTRTNGTLRLTIDKPGGVTLDDCTRLSRALGHALDVEESITHRYRLEVSSPGLDRPLNDRKDFEGAVGRLVRVKTTPSWDGPRVIVGRLEEMDGDVVNVRAADGDARWSVPLAAIAQARLEVEW